jgi:uncharacterized protein YndB with AHSA1/START domain
MSVDVLAEVAIACPRGRVFECVTDPGRDRSWTGGLVEVRPRQPGPLRAGAQVERHTSFLGRRMVYLVEVGEVVAPERVEMTVTEGPFPMQITYALVEEGGQTRMSIRARGEPGGFFAIAGPLLEMATRRQIQADLEKLKGLLEGEARSGLEERGAVR